MHKLVPTIIICYVCFVSLILIQSGEANIKQRNKRYLAFLNNSRFFIKFNVKSNIIPWNQLFAQAVGFRMNWDDPPMTHHPFRTMYRRQVYDYVETLLDKNGLDGFHCVRRAICEMQMIDNPNKIYHKILQIVLRKQSSATNRWHDTTKEECEASISTCPFSLFELSPYTDLG